LLSPPILSALYFLQIYLLFALCFLRIYAKFGQQNMYNLYFNRTVDEMLLSWSREQAPRPEAPFVPGRPAGGEIFRHTAFGKPF
jgi:hypothetical protein